ncbi:MAG: hypothetical protein M4579_003013 [Chaenotheca gracillima]|nr:MAG: hypothetical protein M4579_003013 [Chaenotheca gracillima]
MARNKKRKRAQPRDSTTQPSDSNLMGVGSTLSLLRIPDLPSFNLTPNQASSKTSETVVPQESGIDDADESPGEWQTVPAQNESKRRKLEKKQQSKYPAFEASPQARLQGAPKISDLQNLVLYLLADGPAPQFISVKNHSSIKKVVSVMVPGLERDMFDGTISLQQVSSPENTSSVSNSTSDPASKDGSSKTDGRTSPEAEVTATANGNAASSPDNYCPIPLSYDTAPKPLKPLSAIFNYLWPVRTPGDDKFHKMHSPLQAMLVCPLPRSKDEPEHKGARPPRESKGWENQRTPITEYISSVEQLRDNDFPLHHALLSNPEEIAQEVNRRQSLGFPTTEWVETLVKSLEEGNVPPKQIQKGSLTRGRDLLAMDCEMCQVEGGHSRLTRISLVGWDGEVVLDELVKPEEPIINYLTPYSGITPAMLEPVTTTLADIQKKLLEIIGPRTILIGHSLESDFAALRITHPFIVDTSMIYPHPRGPPLKSSLKWLTQKYLGREIQKGHGSSGHDSIEDAKACLDLVKEKCEKGPKWGTSDASSESIFKRLARATRSSGSTTVSEDDMGKTGAVVDWGQPWKHSGASAKLCISCENDDDVVRGVRNAVNGDADGSIVSGGGVDYVWARLRELEALRGWSNQSRSSDLSAPSAEGVSSTSSPSSQEKLAEAVAMTVNHIKSIYESLPPCTAFIVYSGSGDPREMVRLQGLQQQFKQEYKVKKWDQLSVHWTDTENQELRKALTKARQGIGFVTVK